MVAGEMTPIEQPVIVEEEPEMLMGDIAFEPQKPEPQPEPQPQGPPKPEPIMKMGRIAVPRQMIDD
jgi:hypothetical protein